MTKGKAFILCLMAIMAIFFTMTVIVLINKAELSIIPYAACLTAICALVAAYIGGNVADNGVKGANWSQQMFDSVNSKEAK